MASEQRIVLYEYPFSERVRTLLRLEDLFDKLDYFCAQSHPYCHHTAQQTLNSTPGKAGQHLRDNEWLTSIRSRAGIPGGTCEFDLPSYHAWLMRDPQERASDLQQWIRPLSPFVSGTAIVLKMLRETSTRSQQVAVQGQFQQMLQGRTYALLQVRVAAELGAVPEISANKYMLWICYTAADRELKPKPVERDVPFELALCAF